MTGATPALPDLATLYDVVEHTWPAAKLCEVGPWTLREGAGGGKRVSAATARAPCAAEDVPLAAERMRQMGQPPLFMIRQGEDALDTMLTQLGYEVIDPVNIWACPVAALCTHRPPRTTSFNLWEPMAIQRDIWADGGIGPGRIAVMERAQGPKTALFGRHENRPAATGFVAIHAGIAMVHALEVRTPHRRAGMGRHLMIEAAFWAGDQGAAHLAVICTKANAAANALYTSLGMALVGEYHYRILKEARV